MSKFSNEEPYSSDSERSLQRDDDDENEIEQNAESYLEQSPTHLSFTSHYSNNKDTNSNSTFGDSVYGEPITAPQHIYIDFTPDETVDNEIVQEKVNAFWDFVDAHPELQACIARPEKDIIISESGTVITKASKVPPKATKTPIFSSATSALSLFKKKGIDEAALNFEAVSCPPTPSIDENDFIQNKSESPKPQEDPFKFKHKRVTDRQKKPAKVSLPNIQVPKPEGAKELCENLMEWDKNHPQSFDPPGKTPSII